ncbi:GNAT family N-acetyltransferase [Suicoccus acidiformans]|uniref:GNAT family N-acetyltransferase n=1 Tax=Suicoccus acidiformans TaxID=2036206 RepID=A0A347WN73_9LACT|nr:GNAT family N-acetyltransferase [Suicoccus acidiformans]AXY26530.1 GNAT family N-acetyltransferase [Suicoccus acidiformans]
MDLKHEYQAIVYRDDEGKKLAEITYSLTEDADIVAADHTYVSPTLRGQGVAGKLLDELVSVMQKEGKQIKAVCPYVVRKFQEEPEKYNQINADA